MIVQPRADDLVLIRQTDHAALSGTFAENWGNALFTLPEPRLSVRLAATHHDEGWHQWEASPRVDPATRRPYQFTDLPTAEHAAFYRKGIDRVCARDRYAGLLVCMHLAGLYRLRLGPNNPFGQGQPAADEERDLREILGSLQKQQQELSNSLAAEGVPERLLRDPVLGVNYRLLQFFDRLSLYFCLRPPDERLLEVPCDYSGKVAEIAIHPVATGVVALHPYPFRSVPLLVSVKGHVVPDRAYADDEDFRREFASGVSVEMKFELGER
jgi:hypothetical protein